MKIVAMIIVKIMPFFMKTSFFAKKKPRTYGIFMIPIPSWFYVFFYEIIFAAAF